MLFLQIFVHLKIVTEHFLGSRQVLGVGDLTQFKTAKTEP